MECIKFSLLGSFFRNRINRNLLTLVGGLKIKLIYYQKIKLKFRPLIVGWPFTNIQFNFIRE